MTNGSYLMKAKNRLLRLQRRRDYLKDRLDIEDLPKSLWDVVNAEYSALDWAITVLTEYVELYEIGKGEQYWIREYNLLLAKNHALFNDTLADREDLL